MAGSGSAAVAAKPMTGDELGKRFVQCWGFYNDAKWDDFKGCYANDATSETPGTDMPKMVGAGAIADDTKTVKTAIPDDKGENLLVLVNGHNVVGVTKTYGTNSGVWKTPMGDMPPSNNKVGIFFAQQMELGDDGKVKHEWDWFDLATIMGQMKPDPKHPVRAPMEKAPMATEIVVAKDDATEKANVETAKKLAEAFSKHDVKAVGDLLADDAVWSEQSMPKDETKKELLENEPKFWKAFSDMKITPDKVWAAGDYVAATGTMEGTNDGDLPMMGLKKTGKHVSVPHLVVFKLKDGKIKNAWLFSQGIAFASQLGMMPPTDKKDEKKDAKDAKDTKAPAPAKK
jgi:steroid delta-isomerase-like uncharacterized protein